MIKIDEDKNNDGVYDWLSSFNYFLLTSIPNLIVITGLVIIVGGVIKENSFYIDEGSKLLALGGLSSGLTMVKKPGE